MSARQRKALAISAAVIAGASAATIAYLFYLRPQWRKYVIEASRHLLTVVEGLTRNTPEKRAINMRDEG